MAQEYKMTLAGKEKLEKELEERAGTLRDEITERLKVARSYGDLSENSEYDEARSEQEKNENRINELKYQLDHAVIVAELKKEFTVLRRLDNKQLTYKVVGFGQQTAGMVTEDTPVGAALLNAKAGDVVSFEAPIGIIELEVLKVEEIED